MGGISSSSGSSKAKVIPFTRRELALSGINLEEAQAALQQFLQISQAQSQALPGFLQGLEGTAQVSADAQARLEEIVRGGGVSDAQKALLDQIEQQQIGDIRQGTQENLQLLKQELAPQLGLRGSDSPVLDRGGRVVREGLRQEEAARATRSALELSLPQQEASFLSELQNQDFLQRLNLGQLATSSLGLGNALASQQQAFKPTVANTSTQSSSGFSFG